MKKAALYTYHLRNALHLLFYGYMALEVFDVADLRVLLQGNLRVILIGYVIAVIALSFIARLLDKEVKNPIQANIYPKYMHFAAVSIFVLAFVGSLNFYHDLVYLIIVSFILDLGAFVLSFRSQVTESGNDDELLDDYEID